MLFVVQGEDFKSTTSKLSNNFLKRQQYTLAASFSDLQNDVQLKTVVDFPWCFTAMKTRVSFI